MPSLSHVWRQIACRKKQHATSDCMGQQLLRFFVHHQWQSCLQREAWAYKTKEVAPLGQVFRTKSSHDGNTGELIGSNLAPSTAQAAMAEPKEHANTRSGWLVEVAFSGASTGPF